MKDKTPENEQDTDNIPAEPQVADAADTLRKDLDEAKDRYIRLFAEFENMRKRHDRERSQIIKYAHEEVIMEMLGFFEDFERVIAAAKANPSNATELIKGIEMIYGRMQQLLKKYDVREIEAAGKKFDHNFHEALMAEESAEHEDGTVLEVFQKGFTLGDRVVRTAKVKVSKKN